MSPMRMISRVGYGSKLKSAALIPVRWGLADLPVVSGNCFYSGRNMASKAVTIENINPNILKLEYAVRGPLVIRAGEIEKELQKGVKKPFKRVIRANIGDAHAMGQQPITFIRQVLSCVTYPKLLESDEYPADVKQRAKDILCGCGGQSVGSYTQSQGIDLIRQHVAEYIERRDGHPSKWQDICLSAGASTAIKNCLQLLCNTINGKPSGVMVPIPQYPLYSASLAEYGLTQVGYYLDEDKNWGLDIDELERSLQEASKTCNVRALVVINPGNPTGQTPKSEEEWEKVSDDFNKIWHFPHCIGAMDGKHIVIEAPTFSGSEFFNYKGTFSVVLFAVVDANYNFLYANVGCQGRISDGGVFKNTPFYKLLVEGKLNLPQKRVLLGRDKESPYVLVADDAFPLKPCIMKPYSGHQDKGSIERVFNYRISRARRIVENVFGILASVFRVFRKPMLLQPEKVEKVTLACICLHNYLRCVLSKNKYNPPNSFDVEHIDSGTLEDGAWRKDQQTLQSFFNLQQTARKSSVEAMEIRKEFAEYFMSEQGQVPWQLKFC